MVRAIHFGHRIVLGEKAFLTYLFNTYLHEFHDIHLSKKDKFVMLYFLRSNLNKSEYYKQIVDNLYVCLRFYLFQLLIFMSTD